MHSGQLHFLVNLRRTHVERAPEYVREAEHVVYLVGVIRAAGSHDHILARFYRVRIRDLGVRVGHCKHDWVFGHRFNHFLRNDIGCGKA
ncbi:hypothetical protein D3C87_1984230 [compost metagenome]